jgi:hypothetical protein
MSLAQRVNQTQLQEKDPDAENLLGRELGANSDALYILAQTVLVQDIALQQAKAQVTQLQQQAQQAQQQPAKATSFLGGLFGHHDSPQPGQQGPPPAPMQTQPQYQPGQAPPYQPVPSYQQAPYQQQPPYYPPPGQPQYGQPQYVGAPGGGSSFLRGAMTTAAGVAAGALAFEGVESILHGFGHPGGYGGGFGGGMAGMGMGPGIGLGGGFERPTEETVVNNYYGDSGDRGGERRESGEQFAGAGGGAYNNPDAAYNNPDASSQGGAYENQDASYAQNDQDAGQGGYDQSLADDSSAYDNSVADVQIDDSGGGFDGGGGGFDNSDSNS